VALGGVNYLVPSDVPSVSASAEARVRGASISEADVIDEIQAKSPRVVFLVLDACRNNPFPRAGERSAGNAGGLVGARPARGVFTIYSAGIGQTALDVLQPNDPNRNSVFTRVFVDLLAKPGLDLGGLAIGVRERVADLALNARNESGQAEPHEQNPAYYDQTLGRIFLADLPSEQRKDAAAPPAAAAAAAAAPPTTAIAFSVSGMIVERPVDIGTVVRPGDVLARLDPRVYEAQLVQLQAQVQAAQAAEAQATSQQAKSRKLLADRRVTPQQYGAANAVRQKAQAELATLQGLLENAKYALSASQLRAELDGTVAAVGVEVGQMVMAGQMVVEITRKPEPASDRRGTAK
jgi:biotin carboxyl carrier protein